MLKVDHAAMGCNESFNGSLRDELRIPLMPPVCTGMSAFIWSGWACWLSAPYEIPFEDVLGQRLLVICPARHSWQGLPRNPGGYP